jgi:hypothetical protein
MLYCLLGRFPAPPLIATAESCNRHPTQIQYLHPQKHLSLSLSLPLSANSIYFYCFLSFYTSHFSFPINQINHKDPARNLSTRLSPLSPLAPNFLSPSLYLCLPSTSLYLLPISSSSLQLASLYFISISSSSLLPASLYILSISSSFPLSFSYFFQFPSSSFPLSSNHFF